MHPEQIGRFRVDGVLGHGGGGVVYRAVDGRDGAVVALKMIPPVLAERRSLRRLQREAALLGSLRHPSIARLLEVAADDGRMVLVLEYVAGEDLRRRLAAGPIAAPQLLAIAQGLAEGLAIAHAAGVVHRDLKAENIVIDRTGRGVILDFGLAKLLDSGRRHETTLTAAGERPGTLCAMSPEQVRGEPYDHRSDLFSLGVVMYEMATANHPFRAATPPATIHRICFHEPPTVARDGIGAEAAALIHRLLAKRAARRPPDAAVVAHEIATLRGAPSPLPPLPRPSAKLRTATRGGVLGRIALLLHRATTRSMS